ncbi:MAG: threonine ammonia-lyase [Chloroflexi bacterium]|nr:threonine ammonia-lyase [Chloroflexota bacterium]
MVTLDGIRAAQEAMTPLVHRTPMLLSRTFSQMCGGQVYLKAENLQRTGSFKVRGASNKISRMPRALLSKGVVAASAGNHAQGVALAARHFGALCTVVMPRRAALAKIQATQDYGALVVLSGDSYDEAVVHAQRLSQEEGLTYIHGFDDEHVIEGQGTVGLEIAQEVPDADLVVVPSGGGGLLAGVALALRGLGLQTRVIGVQASRAPGGRESFLARRQVQVPPGPTLAEALAVGGLGEKTLPLILKYVDDLVTVDEEAIAQAMALLLERSKLLVEGAGATPLAALLSGKVEARGKKLVLVVSGGNADLNLMARILEHGLYHAGRYLVLRVVLADKPGQLAQLMARLAEAEANVLEIVHRRQGAHFPPNLAEVEVSLEVRNAEHGGQVCVFLEEAGYLRRAMPFDVAHSFVSREAQAQLEPTAVP